LSEFARYSADPKQTQKAPHADIPAVWYYQLEATSLSTANQVIQIVLQLHYPSICFP